MKNESKKSVENINSSNEKLLLSDVISRFNFDADTESKIIRYLELRGYIKNSKFFNFTKDEWCDIWKEMEMLKDWLVKIGNVL